jgi:hypothetical protein
MSNASSKRPNPTRRTPPVIDLAAKAVSEEPFAPPPADTPELQKLDALHADQDGTKSQATSSQQMPPLQTTADKIPAPAPAIVRKSSFGALFLVGLIGGMFGGIGMLAGLLYTGITIGGEHASIAALQKDIARLNDIAKATAPAITATEGRIGANLSEMQKQITTLGQRFAAIEANPAPATSALASGPSSTQLTNALSTAQDAQAKASAAMDATRSSTITVSRVDTRLAALETTLRNAPSSASARLIMATRLSDALATGRPVKAEIAALATLGIAQDKLAPLTALAGEAIDNVSLASGFKPIAASMRAIETARAAPSAPEGWSGQLWNWATSIVRVRKLDPGAADSTAAIPKLEAALLAGQLREAQRIWQALPTHLRTIPAASAWQARLTARASADHAIDIISADAMTALGSGQR